MKFGLLSTTSWLSLMVAPVRRCNWLRRHKRLTTPSPISAPRRRPLARRARSTILAWFPEWRPFLTAPSTLSCGSGDLLSTSAYPDWADPTVERPASTNGGRLLARLRALMQIQIRKTSVVTVPVLHVCLCCGNTAKIYTLPLLGGHNGSAGQINNRGEAVGFAENGVRDPSAQPGRESMAPDPRFSILKLWYGDRDRARYGNFILSPGDTVGMAIGINDDGQAVGSSGSCANTVIPPFAAGLHAVLWDKDGAAHDLGNLGGTGNPDLLAIGNVANAINNRGQVAGVSAMSGNTTTHAFLWTKERGKMLDLGTLSGDVNSAALGINDRGEMVGASFGAAGPINGNPRAFLWKDGMMTDLNDLIPANSPLHLLTAFGINDAGEIAGFGVTGSGDLHAFLATPCDR